MKGKIEIAIPVLNEEAHLEKQILKILFFINEKLADYSIKIVIADNGSTDNTPKIAKKISLNEKIRFVTTKEKGVGRALKKAWNSSTADIVGYMDLDLATDINSLKKALDKLLYENYVIVNGSRYLPSSKIINRKMHRGIISRIFNSFLKILFFSKITDGMIGFKFLKKEFLPIILNNGAVSNGWIFCSEFLIVGEYLNLPIKEISVRWEDDQSSKVKIFKLTIEYLRALINLKIRFMKKKLKKYAK